MEESSFCVDIGIDFLPVLEYTVSLPSVEVRERQPHDTAGEGSELVAGSAQVSCIIAEIGQFVLVVRCIELDAVVEIIDVVPVT